MANSTPIKYLDSQGLSTLTKAISFANKKKADLTGANFTGAVTATSFVGSLSGTAISATNASTAAKVKNAVTFSTSGGGAPGSSFDGQTALTVDYNTIGAASAGHDHDDSYYLKSQVDDLINEKIAAADAMIYKGTIGSGGIIANIAAVKSTAKTGWTYKVIAGATDKIGGQSLEVGDMVICLTDGSENTDATWTVVQSNIDGAVINSTTATSGNFAIFNDGTGKVIIDSGKKAADFATSDHNHDGVYLKTHPTITTTETTANGTTLSYGDTFTVVESATKDSNGHVTNITTKSFTLPSSDNTDEKVKQTLDNTTTASIPLLFRADASADSGTEGGVKYDNNVTIKPSSGKITAKGFIVSNSTGFLKADGTVDDTAYTTNKGTLTSVQVQAASPLQSSVSAAQGTSLNTTISLINGYGDTKNPYGVKSAGYVLAGPASGTATVPTFRTLAASDIPHITVDKISNFPTTLPNESAFAVSVGSTGLSSYTGTSAVTYSIDASADTDGAFIVTDGVTSATVQLKGKFTDTLYSAGTGLNQIETTFNVDGSAVVNSLTTESSPSSRDDYIVAQCASGGVTSTTYHRKKLSSVFNALNKTDVTNALGYTPPQQDTVYSASGGISLDANNVFKHANNVSPQSTGLYKVAYDSHGHIVSTESVTKADITSLGIPGQDTTYGGAGGIKLDDAEVNFVHSNTATIISACVSVPGLIKVKYDEQGHITKASPVSKADITAVGIPGQDTTYIADTGVEIVESDGNNVIRHTNSVTAVTAHGFYKVKYDEQGHITGNVAVSKADITSLGVPAQDTTYEARNGIKLTSTSDSRNIFEHTNTITAVASASATEFVKFMYDEQGHLTGKTPVTKKDITDLGVPGQDTTYEAELGISVTDGKFGHTNSVTAVTSAGFYKVKYDEQGHITGNVAVSKADITSLGVPAQDTTYEATDGIKLESGYFKHTNNISAKSAGLYKVAYDSHGHIVSTVAVSKADITSLGVPAQDTTYGGAGGIKLDDAGANFVHSNTATVISSCVYMPGFVKVKYDNQGHITSASPVSKADITAVGIPGQDTTYIADTGVKIINVSGSNVIRHTNSVTATTNLGGTEDCTLGYGSTFSIPHISYDAQGHITASGTHTITIPESDNTHYQTGLVVASTSNGSANTTATNGNVFLNLKDDDVIRASHKITGSGITSVTADENGTITISTPNDYYTKNEVDTKLTSVFKYKGTISAADGLPNSSASVGDAYYISADREYIVGTGTKTNTKTIKCEVGDLIVCTGNGTSSTYATWTVVENNAHVMVGATDSASGTAGFVPAPNSEQKDKYLKGDGTWDTPYTHPSYNATSSAAAVKVGRDSTGHVVIGDVLDASDLKLTSSYIKADSVTNISSTNTIQDAVAILEKALDGKSDTEHVHDDYALNSAIIEACEASMSNIEASNAMQYGGVRYDLLQTLTDEQKSQARINIGVSNVTAATVISWGFAKNSEKVNVSGFRGYLAGYEIPESKNTNITINADSRDVIILTNASTITVSNGPSDTYWMKTIGIKDANTIVSLGTSWAWSGGKVPTISANCILACRWIHDFGIASIISAGS